MRRLCNPSLETGANDRPAARGRRWRSLVPLAVMAFAACMRSPDREHVDAVFAVDARVARNVADEAMRRHGEELFVTRIGAHACVDCHAREGRLQDGGVHGRNTISLLDVGRQFAWGWDGAGASLVAMVRRELAQRHGMDLATPLTEGAIPQDPAIAIAAYLDSLRTHSAWDRYVEGDDEALSRAGRDGLAAFLEVGCAACHGTRNLGGRSFHKLGAAVPYATTDVGRMGVTGSGADRAVFKAPMLRHAAATAPYLHDGSVATLRETVVLMARIELGKELSDSDADAIVAFLVEVAGSDGDGG